MSISIIVPVYNVEPYLARCIESIIAQSYTDWELILVDDGSPDHCPEICDTYAIKDKRIKVIHKKNGGLSDARNHGLDVASKDYILFVDSDDFIHPNMLQTMIRLGIEKNADIVQCGYIRGISSVFPAIKESQKLHSYDSHSIFTSTKQQTILWAKLYRRSLWNNIRMPVGKIHEDEFTTWKLYYHSHITVIIETPYYYYYKNPSGIMSNEARRFNSAFIEAHNERISFLQKQKENMLVTLATWRVSISLTYFYLRGNITKEESEYMHYLLQKNIKSFVRCKQVPWTHRTLFAFLRIFIKPLRILSLMIGTAHTIKKIT